MEVKDIIISSIIFIFLLFGSAIYANYKKRRYPEYRFFTWGLMVKLIGAVGFASVYKFYYGYGDTFVYFDSAVAYFDFFVDFPLEGLKLFFISSDQLADPIFRSSFEQLPHFITPNIPIQFYLQSDFFLMSKLLFPFLLITYKSYFASTMLFSAFSFVGIWKLYRSFIFRYPDGIKILSVIVLFIPSVFFWGSGIMKDTVTIGCLGWFVFAFFQLNMKKNLLTNSLFVIFTIYILWVLKPYVLFSLFPSIGLWYLIQFNKKITSTVLKVMVVPFVFLIITIMVYGGVFMIAAETERFSFETMAKTAESYQSWHYSLKETGEGGGSAYTLGEFDFTPTGVLIKSPEALVVTYFRPFFWEIGSPIMLLSAVESLLILYFFCYVFILKKGIFRLKTITSSSDIVMCLSFAVILGIAIGITTYNFGALVRYKIPCLPFFLIGLWLVSRANKKKLQVHG